MNLITPAPGKKFILTTLVLLSFIGVKANHLFGADITYKCTTTPGIFEVTLKLYRNCDDPDNFCPTSCGASCTQTLTISGADPGCATTSFGTFNLSLVNVMDISLNLACPNSKNTCKNQGCVTPGTYTPSVEEFEFRGFANVGPTSGIPSSCCNVRLSYSLCCRSTSIATGPAGAPFYVDAVINRCIAVSPCNGSPVLANSPMAFPCGGESFVFNNGAIDPDRDSLSFAFAPALEGYNTGATYTSPWSASTPMPFSGAANAQFPGGIRCDPLTGDISFTPGNGGSTPFMGLIAIEIKQWKNINNVPTVIGITRRDIQTIVLANCTPNNPPVLATNPTHPINPRQPKTNWETFAGEQLCFTVTAKDTDYIPLTLSDTTYLSWNQSLSTYSATFTPTYIAANRKKPAPLGGPREDTYRFCWTPPNNLISTLPYYFTLSAKDSRCPNPGRITRAFSITVIENPHLSITQKSLTCKDALFKFTHANTQLAGITTEWQIANDTNNKSFSSNFNSYTANTGVAFAYTFSKSGKYYFQLVARSAQTGGVIQTILDSVEVAKTTLQDSVFISPVTCSGLTNGALSIAGKFGLPPYLYAFKSSPSFSPTNYFDHLSYGKYAFSIKDSEGCILTDSVLVPQPNPLLPILHFSRAACDTFGILKTKISGGSAPFSYRINTSSFQSDSVFTINKPGKYTIDIRDSNDCAQHDSININLPSTFKYSFLKKDITCFGSKNGTLTLTAAGGNSNGLYTYRNIHTQQTNASGLFEQLDSISYQFTIADDSNCILTHTEKWLTPSQLSIDTITGNAKPMLKQTQSYSVTNDPLLLYTWNIKKGTIVSGQGTSAVSVTWDSVGIDTIELEARNISNCTTSTTKLITIDAVGMNELSSAMGLTISPNPTHHFVTISVKSITENNILSLYDLQGKIILQQELLFSQQLNMQELPEGIYIIQVGDWHGKIIKN